MNYWQTSYSEELSAGVYVVDYVLATPLPLDSNLEFHLNIEAATSFDDVSGTIGVLVLEDDVASQKNWNENEIDFILYPFQSDPKFCKEHYGR